MILCQMSWAQFNAMKTDSHPIRRSVSPLMTDGILTRFGLVYMYIYLTWHLITVDCRQYIIRGGGAGLLQWVGGPRSASFGFYLREVFQSQTNTVKILYNKSH